MKAIVCTKYGSPDVLRFKEVEKPTPKEKSSLLYEELINVFKDRYRPTVRILAL